MAKREIRCPYCNELAELISSTEIYGKDYGMIWMCKSCDAYVGTHKHSKNHAPLGTLADKDTRYWRKEAHKVFDPLWEAYQARFKVGKSEARNYAYTQVAHAMNMPVKSCHVALFDVKQCQQMIKICTLIGEF